MPSPALVPEVNASIDGELGNLQRDVRAMFVELRKLADGQQAVQNAVAAIGDNVASLLSNSSPIQSDSTTDDPSAEDKMGFSPAPTGSKCESPERTKQTRAASKGSTGVTSEVTFDSDCRKMSKNTFANIMQTEDDDMNMLQRVFETYESIESKAESLRILQQDKLAYTRAMFAQMDTPSMDLFIDSAMGLLITLNAIVIGISMDSDDGSALWMTIDTTFSFFFCAELAVKIWLHGVCGHFCGPLRFSNTFDAALIVIDMLQLILRLSGSTVEGAPSASLFRMVRLFKLARVLRLLRSPVFKDLLSMMQGMIGGMPTLVWSMLLFFITVYVVSLLFREFFGRRYVVDVYEHFGSVPRSMFTTFRCSFGDCSTSSGTPIFEAIYDEYGGFYILFYCMFAFIVTIGLFNVISAIFVESTMCAATALQQKKKKARLQDDNLWATRIATLVKRLMVISNDGALPEKMSDALELIYALDVPGSRIDELVKDPEAIAALGDLDIDPEDHDYLSDFLDPDNGGTIRVIELIEGIRRLRGDPRRSDIVTVDLMVRSIQRNVAQLMTMAKANQAE
eukprot:TRINITY_DN23324_c0_g1_i1.p1 TRINITY_DN23324_c0_g1~~TRINITY_DN23324_c0_g1_i1.p1  ORF type:complete len:566 (+),score=93.12 TRINITY_DN23324_c0_g1_i1:69-1766(+)